MHSALHNPTIAPQPPLLAKTQPLPHHLRDRKGLPHVPRPTAEWRPAARAGGWKDAQEGVCVGGREEGGGG